MLDLGPSFAIDEVVCPVLLVLHEFKFALERGVEVILNVVVSPARQQLGNF